MHQLDRGPGIVTGFDRELPAVLLDSLGGSQEADDDLFPLSPLVQRTLGGLAAGVDAGLADAEGGACDTERARTPKTKIDGAPKNGTERRTRPRVFYGVDVRVSLYLWL